MMIVRFRTGGLLRPASPVLSPAPEPTLLGADSRSVLRPLSRTVTWRDELRFVLKASRPGFWLTSAWFYLLPLAPYFPIRSLAFWLGLFYIGFPLGMLLYAANDLTDEVTDRLNPRKDSFLFGARPTRDQLAVLPWCILLAQAPFAALFWVFIGPRALLWFVVAFVASLLYNVRGGAKDRPLFDVLHQTCFLLVFVLSCWLNGVPLSPWPIWVFGALFAMHSHLFGQIMDIAPDAAAGRRTTATVIGPVASKLLIALMMSVEALVALSVTTKPWLTPFVALGAVGFGFDALVWRERPYARWQMTGFFLGWNALLMAEIACSVGLLRAF